MPYFVQFNILLQLGETKVQYYFYGEIKKLELRKAISVVRESKYKHLHVDYTLLYSLVFLDHNSDPKTKEATANYFGTVVIDLTTNPSNTKWKDKANTDVIVNVSNNPNGDNDSWDKDMDGKDNGLVVPYSYSSSYVE